MLREESRDAREKTEYRGWEITTAGGRAAREPRTPAEKVNCEKLSGERRKECAEEKEEWREEARAE